MKNRIKILVLSISLIFIAICCVSVFILRENNIENVSKEPNEPIKVGVINSALIERQDMNDLFIKSSLIVEGIVVSQSNFFTIMNWRGYSAVHTDYLFEIDTTYRGNPYSDTIIIRLMKDFATTEIVEINEENEEMNIYTVGNDIMPSFQIGHQYLLFLHVPGMGDAFNTEGDYYYVSGSKQGTFETNEYGYISQCKTNGISVKKLEERIDALKDTPVDEYYFRNEYIENQKINVETGAITENAFKDRMENIDKYAVIVE
jgi:hypothetical protein